MGGLEGNCLNMFEGVETFLLTLAGRGAMWQVLERPIGRPGREMFKHICLNMFEGAETFLLTLAGRGGHVGGPEEAYWEAWKGNV